MSTAHSHGNSALVAGLSPGVVILPASKEERHRERVEEPERVGEQESRAACGEEGVGFACAWEREARNK